VYLLLLLRCRTYSVTALLLLILGGLAMLRFWTLALVAMMLLFAGLVRVTSAAGDKEIKIEDKLTTDDPKDKKVGSYSKVHPLKFEGGKAYVIDMVSKDVDSILRLEDKTGKELAFDDDGGGFPNAKIVFKCPKEDEYKVICTSFPKPEQNLKQVGNYTLTVRLATKEEVAKAFPHDFMLGKPAPDVVGEFSLNGPAKKLSELKGKVVLIDYWAVWCGPCIATFPHLRDWTKEYKKDGLEILGVTTYFEVFGFDKETGKLTMLKEDKDKDKDKETKAPPMLKPVDEQNMVKDFVGYHKLTHEILMISKAAWDQASKDYHVEGIPTAVLVDRQGNVRMVRVGSSEENAQALEEEIKKLLAEK
jgi:thiol-disulfide isomerase/thioredoxin